MSNTAVADPMATAIASSFGRALPRAKLLLITVTSTMITSPAETSQLSIRTDPYLHSDNNNIACMFK